MIANIHDLYESVKSCILFESGETRYDHPVTTEERLIKSTQARRHFRDVLDDAEKGVFTGISHWNDPPTVWVVPDDWYQKAKKCLGGKVYERSIKSDWARRYFRDVLNGPNDGIHFGIGRWDDPPTAWVVSADWYQEATACLAEQTGRRKP